MPQDNEKLKSCISTCFYIFQQLRENSNLFDPPPPKDVIENFDWRMQNLSRALRFANGENIEFDVALIKKIVSEFIKNSFTPDEQIAMERALWDLCTRRTMLPTPRVQRENGKRITSLIFVRENFDEIKALLRSTRVKKSALREFAKRRGFRFSETALLRAFNELNRRRK